MGDFLGDISNLVIAFSAIGSIVIIYFTARYTANQVEISTKSNKLSAKANELTAFLELIKYIQDKEVREARRVLIEELGVNNKDYEKWGEEEKKQVEIVYHAYNFAGLMEDHGLIKKDFVARGWRDSIIKCWTTAEPMIMEDRKKRGDDFLDKFKMLYDKAKKVDDEEFSSFSQKQVESWKSKKQKK